MIEPDTDRVFDLTNHEVTIGRKNCGADIGLDDPQNMLARHHCKTVWNESGGSHFIFDMSTNGVFINKQLIGQGQQKELSVGDELVMGTAVLVYDYSED